jgi:HSP20 family molecular chaperone IbpA
MERSGARAARPAEAEFRTPAVDIFETDDSVVLLADMPGVNEKSVEVAVEQDTLTIAGRVEAKPAERARVYTEYASRPFRRSFTLSVDLRRDGIEGKMRNGVLRLTLRKAEEAKARRIPIKS